MMRRSHAEPTHMMEQELRRADMMMNSSCGIERGGSAISSPLRVISVRCMRARPSCEQARGSTHHISQPPLLLLARREPCLLRRHSVARLGSGGDSPGRVTVVRLARRANAAPAAPRARGRARRRRPRRRSRCWPRRGRLRRRRRPRAARARRAARRRTCVNDV